MHGDERPEREINPNKNKMRHTGRKWRRRVFVAQAETWEIINEIPESGALMFELGDWKLLLLRCGSQIYSGCWAGQFHSQ